MGIKCFCFSIVLRVGIRMSTTYSFTHKVSVRLRTIMAFPIRASCVVENRTDTTSRAPTGGLLQVNKDFRARAILTKLTPFIDRAGLASTLVQPFKRVLRVARRRNFRRFLFRTRYFRDLYLIRQWQAIRMTHTSSINFRLFVCLNVGRGTTASGWVGGRGSGFCCVLRRVVVVGLWNSWDVGRGGVDAGV